MELVPFPTDNDSCRVFTGQRKHHSRLGVEASSGQQQLAPVPGSVRYIESSDGSIHYRPIRLQNEPPAPSILQLEAQSRGFGSRCFLHILGSEYSLSLPSILSSWQSLVKDSERGSCLCMLDSTAMADTSLVPTAVVNAGGTSTAASRPRRPASESRTSSTSLSVGRESTLDRLACLR